MAGKKGRSGKNRPLPTRAMKEALLKELKAKRDSMSQIVWALIAKAKSGDVQAIKEIFDRIDGKVPTALTGADGEGPVVINEIRRVIISADD